MSRVYLDHNATSPLRETAREAMISALGRVGNASSVHNEGRKARSVIERAREEVAELVNGAAKNVIFTSGGTEANNMALSPWVVASTRAGANPHEIVCFLSCIEHPCVLSGGRFAWESDRLSNIQRLQVSGEGIVILSELCERIDAYVLDNPDTPFLVSVMMANNETGSVQPIREIAEIVHAKGGLLHTDAVQCAGKLRIDIKELGADLLTLSAHKIGGPQGVGALVLGSGDILVGKPLISGGGQEMNRRAGTENVAAIAGFGAAAKEAAMELGAVATIEKMRDRMEAELLVIAPEIKIFSNNVERLPNTSCFGVSGLTAETLLIGLDLKGVAVSAGSACSSGKVDSSHVLRAMKVSDDLLECAIRVSLGWNSTDKDIDQFIAVWSDIYHKFKRSQAAA